MPLARGLFRFQPSGWGPQSLTSSGVGSLSTLDPVVVSNVVLLTGERPPSLHHLVSLSTGQLATWQLAFLKCTCRGQSPPHLQAS